MARRKIKHKEEEASVADAVSIGFGELETLAQEMGDWRDNMEEKLSHTDKFQAVSDAADTLEGFREPDIDNETLKNLRVKWADVLPYDRRKGLSRSARRDNAVAALRAVLDLCNDLDEDSDEVKVVVATTEQKEALREAVDQLKSDLEDVVDDADGVEFPGMYG